MVFCGLFPVDAADFEKLRESIARLRLNDASFCFEMENYGDTCNNPLTPPNPSRHHMRQPFARRLFARAGRIMA